MNTISINEDEMNKVAGAILDLAIKCSDDVHIFVSYSPHVYLFTIRVREFDYDYHGEDKEYIYENSIYLNKEDCVLALWDAHFELAALVRDKTPGVPNEGK